MNPKSLNISVETFDALNEKHEFSEEYKAKKRAMLKEYKRHALPSPAMRFARAAIAACFVLVLTPIAANAATDGELFNRIWGNSGKNNVASHDEVVYDEEKGTSFIVTYPQRDYEAVDPQKAEKLIGDNVSYEPVVKQFGDTTLTVLSSVTDGNAAIVEFTLEKEGGVNALNYSQLDNEAKGADISKDADFYFGFAECSGSIFVDLEKSSGDKLYCYYYMVMDACGEAAHSLTLETEQYPCTRKELFEAEGKTYEKLSNETITDTISIPLEQPVATTVYRNPDNGCATVSPLSLKIDMNTGLGLTEEEAWDIYNVYYAAVNYKDGASYVITDGAREGIHSCETDIDNASYTCGVDNSLTFVFNRLVDTAEIDSITVNETTYSLK